MLGVVTAVLRLAHAHVRRDAAGLMEDLDGGGRGAHFHGLPGQLIGHAVEAALELDVIVDVDRGLPTTPRDQSARQAAGAARVDRLPQNKLRREPRVSGRAVGSAFSISSPIAWLVRGARRTAVRSAATIQRVGNLHADFDFGFVARLRGRAGNTPMP